MITIYSGNLKFDIKCSPYSQMLSMIFPASESL